MIQFNDVPAPQVLPAAAIGTEAFRQQAFGAGKIGREVAAAIKARLGAALEDGGDGAFKQAFSAALVDVIAIAEGAMALANEEAQNSCSGG